MTDANPILKKYANALYVIEDDGKVSTDAAWMALDLALLDQKTLYEVDSASIDKLLAYVMREEWNCAAVENMNAVDTAIALLEAAKRDYANQQAAIATVAKERDAAKSELAALKAQRITWDGNGVTIGSEGVTVHDENMAELWRLIDKFASADTAKLIRREYVKYMTGNKP